MAEVFVNQVLTVLDRAQFHKHVRLAFTAVQLDYLPRQLIVQQDITVLEAQFHPRQLMEQLETNVLKDPTAPKEAKPLQSVHQERFQM
jgi:hypothetical protein